MDGILDVREMRVRYALIWLFQNRLSLYTKRKKSISVKVLLLSVKIRLADKDHSDLSQ